MIVQTDYKRQLAASTVAQMGLCSSNAH
ncbi:proton-conducting transporter membrane subunit [Bacillus licheniformis]|nr:proton-conducting transporter membrane subunit [Bacillus licheniformis]